MSGGADRLDLIARVVAMTVNPIVLVPVFFAWTLAGAGWPPGALLGAVGIATLFLSLIPVLSIVWMVRTGRAETIEVRDRTRRTGPFLAAFLGGMATLACALAVEWPSPALFEPLVGTFVANTAILGAVTSRFKISLHVASIAGFVSMAGWIAWTTSTPLGGPVGAALLVPVVMWSRVRTGAHTLPEVAAGAGYGFVVSALELETLYRAGRLILD
jgi:membrane-associated phospholipid phosphatase